mmetsp:Transcript_4194/g.10766  ORF Transcript_4194/g.10766 Transcript_4194/m.10766 type:complete len:213 (+) Transcript_4194:1639-2277(+)
MMSLAGPPLLLASATTPAAIYSTTPIPKCSSTMVWMPTKAWDKKSLIWLNGTFTWNSTLAEMSSSSALRLRLSTRRMSPSFRQPPTITSRLCSTDLSVAGLPSACFSARAYASSCTSWAFSGLNWPMETITGFFAFRFGPLSGIWASSSVLQGGKTRKGCQRPAPTPSPSPSSSRSPPPPPPPSPAFSASALPSVARPRGFVHQYFHQIFSM